MSRSSAFFTRSLGARTVFSCGHLNLNFLFPGVFKPGTLGGELARIQTLRNIDRQFLLIASVLAVPTALGWRNAGPIRRQRSHGPGQCGPVCLEPVP